MIFRALKFMNDEIVKTVIVTFTATLCLYQV